MKILLPKTDVIFKLLFGNPNNKNILSDFLLSVLNLDKSEFEDITITDPHMKREYPEDKLGILDVKLITKSGHILDIEIQVLPMPEMKSRITYYQANMITEQLSAGSRYSELKRAICILITDYPLFKETDRYHTIFGMMEKTEHFLFNDLIEIHVLDLTKIPQDEESKLADWMRFLKAEREEEFDMAAANNTAINEAYAKLKVLSDSEANQVLYESRLKAQRDEWSRIDGAVKENQREIAKKLLELNLSVNQIISVTGLSIDEVNQLQ